LKYDEFAGLCDREWLKGADKMEFGDVTALSLTDESLAELSGEAFAVSTDSLPAGFPPPGGADVGVLVTEAVNPVTRSAVKITGGAESDTATVSYGAGSYATTRTIPVS
jgi:hypothetical protein